MTRTASSNEAKCKIAKRRIESFSKRFGEPHFYLACHAAFPLALTPDLLYRLWANFQQDVNSNLLNIPWIAVADLLLSKLSNEVGYELYEIDWAIRNELLNRLKNNPRFGQQRILELSNFLVAYMREQLNSSNPDTRDFAQAQKWTALAYAQPHEAAREIASNLASLNIEDGSEWIRLTSLVQTLADPLVGYEPLLVYVSGMKSFARGNVSEAKNLLSQVMDSKDEIKVTGVKLLIPDQFKAKPIPKVSFKTKRHRWLIGVSLAVAVVGTGIFIWQKLNPIEFQQVWNSLLNQEQKVTKENIVWIQGIILKGHSSYVYSVSFSPDGKILASASADKTVKLWNTTTGKEIKTLTGHTDTVYDISFSPDGKMLASASADKTVKLWDTSTGKEIKTLTGHTDTVYDISFSPDGKMLASASSDKTVRLWDTSTGKEIKTLTGHTNAVYGIRFSPDGKMLASASGDKTVKLWDTSTGKEIKTLTGHTNAVYGIRFSPDGKMLASASGDKTVKLWDTSTGKEIKTLTGHTNIVTSANFSPDGKTIASSGNDNTIKIWSFDGKELQTLNLQNPVTSVVFSPDAQTLASASGNDVILWHRATVDNLITALKNPSVDVRRTAASALGSLGSQAKTAVPVLTEALKDSDSGVRQNADSALKRIPR
ncbi:HEAT repeat domain-containing protein [Nostoc sp. FACHB-133]|uniref:WD40 domain-containing protein n=1 Tax=Nostoc sp. FACHB-133 TaxID=2692835 RepID=UPI0016866E2A|nr:HEAT repeat domain-containing protein [Nostoc sp. FACHB-133]MBD2525150.1 HEAT repeat domain-containing protein [Nostoc sp. FACHB-133]